MGCISTLVHKVDRSSNRRMARRIMGKGQDGRHAAGSKGALERL